jgi:putative NIF3 family GTP cyclohydrolase 1 type 2
MPNPAFPAMPAVLTAAELCAWLRGLHAVPEPSVDRIVAGRPDTPVRGIAVLWMPTWAALREAAAQGLNVVIAHEPTFYTHRDLDGFDAAMAPLDPRARAAITVTRDEKLRWIEDNKLVVIRCHDVLDAMPGGVVDSLAAALGFTAGDYVTSVPHHRVVRLAVPAPAGDVARRLAISFQTIGQPGVGFYGDANRRVQTLALGTGYGNDPWRHFALGADMALAIDDRIKTWSEPVWAEDAGYPIVVINHGTSEEWGVRRLAAIVAAGHPAVPVRLLPQGCGYRWITPPVR